MKSGATPKSPRRRWVRLLQWALVLLPVCALGCRHILFCGPILPSQPLPATKMIDVHCHAAGIGAGDSGCFVSKALQDNFKFGLYLKTFGVTEAELKAQGDGLIMKRMSGQIAASHHVGWAVVLALDGVVNAQGELDLAQTEVYIPNEFVAREVAKQEPTAQVRATRHDATVMYADLRNFSSYCEGRPPEETAMVLHMFFTTASRIIEQHGGVVEQMVGDGLLAVWNGSSPCRPFPVRGAPPAGWAAGPWWRGSCCAAPCGRPWNCSRHCCRPGSTTGRRPGRTAPACCP